MHQQTLVATGIALLATLPAAQAGMYTKNSPVLQVDGKTYDRLIAQSNHTSVGEPAPDTELPLMDSRCSSSTRRGAVTART
jgi:hypothetical protein